MDNSGAPIIFIQYGGAAYLAKTLRAAVSSNLGKRIILLGDEKNRRMVPRGVDFFNFEAFSGSKKEQAFQENFQVIKGERHRYNKENGVEFWLKFVFWRWFLIEAFLEREGLDSFWTFDSDTILTANLEGAEAHFRGVECTVQCMGKCLNGWVGSRNLVQRYTDSIIAQFRDVPYLEKQKELLKCSPTLSFNEMDAFAEFRRRESVKTWHAELPIKGEIFDDALAFTEGFEAAPQKVLGKTAIKRLWTDGVNIYAKHLATGTFVRLLTCNMSWMPDFMWRRIMAVVKGSGNGLRVASRGLQMSKLVEISTVEPILDRFFRKTKMLIWKVRRGF